MYLKVRTDPYATREVSQPRSFREPEWKEDLRIAETEDHRDALGPPVIPSNSALPMRQPWLADLGSQVNTALSYGPGSKGFEEAQKPKTVHGVVRSSGITPSTNLGFELKYLQDAPERTDLYNALVNEIQTMEGQTGGDKIPAQLLAQWQAEWSATASESSDQQAADQEKILGQMADYATQFYEFYEGNLTGPSKLYPKKKAFFTSKGGQQIWEDLENLRLADYNDGQASSETSDAALKFLADMCTMVEQEAQKTKVDNKIFGIEPKLPDTGIPWSAASVLTYFADVQSFDQQNGTTFATQVAMMLFNLGIDQTTGSGWTQNKGFWGSYAATDKQGDKINIYGNLFNTSEDASNAVSKLNPQYDPSAQTNQYDNWQNLLNNNTVTITNPDGSTSSGAYTDMQFKVAVVNAMTQLIMLSWQINNAWVPSATEVSAMAAAGGDQILIVPAGGSYTPPPVPSPSGSGGTSPSNHGGKPLPPGPTPTWEYVALAAGGGLLAYLIWRQV